MRLSYRYARSRPAPGRSRWFVRVALLLVVALLSHSFDNCAAHVGEFGRHDAGVPTISARCTNDGGPCRLCVAGQGEPHIDACDVLSETAVFAAAQHLPTPSDALWFTAPAPATPRVVAPSGCLFGRAHPPPSRLIAKLLRASLPDRAPPASA